MTLVNSELEIVKQFILQEFLPGEDPNLLAPDTPLMSSGILDSINTLKLAMFIESEFNVELEAHETSVEYLDTLEKIVTLIQSKR